MTRAHKTTEQPGLVTPKKHERGKRERRLAIFAERRAGSLGSSFPSAARCNALLRFDPGRDHEAARGGRTEGGEKEELARAPENKTPEKPLPSLPRPAGGFSERTAALTRTYKTQTASRPARKQGGRVAFRTHRARTPRKPNVQAQTAGHCGVFRRSKGGGRGWQMELRHALRGGIPWKEGAKQAVTSG